jgi:hypothetical protein
VYLGDIYTSINSGATWTDDTASTSLHGQDWHGLSSDSSGKYLAAVAYGGDIYTSINSGATWTNDTTGTPESGVTWEGIASNASGQYLVAGAYGGDIYTADDPALAPPTTITPSASTSTTSTSTAAAIKTPNTGYGMPLSRNPWETFGIYSTTAISLVAITFGSRKYLDRKSK